MPPPGVPYAKPNPRTLSIEPILPELHSEHIPILEDPVHSLHINEMDPAIEPDPPVASNIKIKLNKPPTFDGSYSKYRSWLQKVELFHRGHKITNDEQKIIMTLSYMTEGPALDWCQAYTDHALTNDNFGTWAVFKSNLDHRFKDQVTKEKTREKLETFRQERQHIDEFIANLE